MSVDVLGYTLAIAAIALTIAMFMSRSAMLGFPCAIFWAVLGGFSYTQSAATWDIPYFLFFASFGMAIFSMLAAFGLRTKKEEAEEGDLYFDEGGDDDVKFIDEYASPAKAKDYYDEYGNVRPKYAKKEVDEEVVGDKTKNVRERATARRRRFDH